jgi:hypothetical protein
MVPTPPFVAITDLRPEGSFRREDETDDGLLHAQPGLVVHVDDFATEAIARYFGPFEEGVTFSQPGYPSHGLPPFSSLREAAASVCLGSAYEGAKPPVKSKYGSEFGAVLSPAPKRLLPQQQDTSLA